MTKETAQSAIVFMIPSSDHVILAQCRNIAC
jgi:hypothetical protein